jgi:hypothetical protein
LQQVAAGFSISIDKQFFYQTNTKIGLDHTIHDGNISVQDGRDLVVIDKAAPKTVLLDVDMKSITPHTKKYSHRFRKALPRKIT